MKTRYTLLLFFLVLILFSFTFLKKDKITVGAKHFNEGYILSEILSQLLESNGYEVERRFNLGGTLICYEALKNNEIQVYPEYTGTIKEEILKDKNKISTDSIRSLTQKNLNLTFSPPYGFNNTYALTMKKSLAEKLGIKTISDLRNHPSLKLGLSYEFVKRQDGWGNLAKAYGLPQKPVGIEHGLAYSALEEGKIDLTDAYSTDGEITKYDLVILEDDKNFFPDYSAVSFYRTELDGDTKSILNSLNGKIDEQQMQEMNAAVLYQNKSFAEVANDFLKKENLIHHQTEFQETHVLSDILSKTLVHIKISAIAILIAILISVPLGVLIYMQKNLTRPVLYMTGILQTIPSIALFALMIPLFGIGVLPAIVALVLYALLPITRNTVTGLLSVDPLLKTVSDGLGLTTIQKLKYVEFPLSLPSILAGIKTSAVIIVGLTTIAAFIGAGGLGEFIVTGLALNNTELILMGAIPSAILAILTELFFEMIERISVPSLLRQAKK
jgi:osmoprotectant transport system permease protein